MIGVGGGIRKQGTNLRRGDVVIGDLIYHWDFGVFLEEYDYRSRPKGTTVIPPKRLGSVVARILHSDVEEDFHWIVRNMMMDRKQQKRFQPPEEIDLDEDSSDLPTIYKGGIASGSGVIKQVAMRDWISRQCPRAICMDMESAGIRQHHNCLSVRGISDFADVEFHKDWRGYAAFTAAAAGKVILQNLPLTGMLSLSVEIRKR